MEDSTKKRDSPSVINSAEIVEELGNMFIVKVDDELKQVPANYKNELLYKHKLYQLLHPDTRDERVVLTDDKDNRFIAIAPTQNDSIYRIWIDDNPYPVMNPPSMAEDVLRGVRDAIQAPSDYGQLNDVYERIRSKQVRRYVIDKAMSLFPKSEVVPEDEGWNVMGIFLLTWDARVFLNTGSVEDQSAYRVRGSGVSETDEAKEFLQLHVNDEVFEKYRDLELEIHYPLPKQMDFDGQEVIDKECPTCGNENSYKYHDIQQAIQGSQSQPQRPVYICTDESCGQSWQTYNLTEREIEFISKARWLLNHRENLDDDAFWDVIESYVWKGGS